MSTVHVWAHTYCTLVCVGVHRQIHTYIQTHTYSTNSQACIKMESFKKQLDHWDVTKPGHFSRFIMGIQIQIALTFFYSVHSYPVVLSATAMCYLAEEKAKAPVLITTEPLKALGCILTIQDPRQLQALSSCLTNSPLHYGLLADTLPQPSPLNHHC